MKKIALIILTMFVPSAIMAQTDLSTVAIAAPSDPNNWVAVGLFLLVSILAAVTKVYKNVFNEKVSTIIGLVATSLSAIYVYVDKTPQTEWSFMQILIIALPLIVGSLAKNPTPLDLNKE